MQVRVVVILRRERLECFGIPFKIKRAKIIDGNAQPGLEHSGNFLMHLAPIPRRKLKPLL
jgi:hypothetical protein